MYCFLALPYIPLTNMSLAESLLVCLMILQFYSIVLDTLAFERLLGPCMEILRMRNCCANKLFLRLILSQPHLDSPLKVRVNRMLKNSSNNQG